jgi:4-amino-4-deoxy-L-arabinose transferase-like glycosyltransferase
MKIFIRIMFTLAIFVNLWTLKDGHNWGDDFAQYIINARNIIESKPFASGVMLDNAVIYPPGLPLLLAPVLKVFGLNFKILKFLNIFCWYLAIIFIYALFVRLEGRRFALMAAVFLAFSSFFFVYKQNVLSDIPFFLFVCSSLYAFERWKNNSSKWPERLYFIGFLSSISFALWLRSAGVTLFAAALFYFIFINRDKKALAALFTVFLINEFLLFFWMGWHPGFLTAVASGTPIFLHHVLNNFSTVYRSLFFFFCPTQTVFSQRLFNMVDPLICLTAPVLYLMMLWSFIRGFQKKKISYLECFSFFYISLLIFWSGFTMSPDGFTRFVLPLLPYVFISGRRFLAFLKRFKLDCHGCASVVFLVLLLINLTNVIINLDFNDDVFNLPENRELVNWVKQNMRPNEHFMFWKPRALALLTERTGAPPWIFPQQRQYFTQRVKDLNITYIFSLKFNDFQHLTAQLEMNHQFRLVWENGVYKVFKFIH